LGNPVYRVKPLRGVQNLTKMSDISFLKTEPNWPQNSNTENSVSAVQFSKTDFGSLATVFHVVAFTIHLPTWQDQQSKYFSSPSISALQLRISWTNSARKYVISSIIHKTVNWKALSRLHSH